MDIRWVAASAGLLAVTGAMEATAQAVGSGPAGPPVHVAGVAGKVAGISRAPDPGVVPGRDRVERRTGIVVLPDGRVFANVGRGYEQVVRPCGGRSVLETGLTVAPAIRQPSVVQPSVAQPQPGVSPRLPYTPAVPIPGSTSRPNAPTCGQTALTLAP